MLHFSGGPFSHIVALHITEMGALSCLVEHPSLFATGARRIRQKKSTDYFSFLPKYIFVTCLGIRLATLSLQSPLGGSMRQNHKGLHDDLEVK